MNITSTDDSFISVLKKFSFCNSFSHHCRVEVLKLHIESKLSTWLEHTILSSFQETLHHAKLSVSLMR